MFMRYILPIFLALLCGCVSLPKGEGLTRETHPRHNQKRWLKEREVINNVVAYVEYSKYASRRPQALREYALYIRLSYANVSIGGQDVDAGVRALNYIHKIHAECGGSPKLWNDVLALSRILGEGDERQGTGLEPPPDYK